MVKRSSYRLGRRLKASRKDRLDYITYLNSDGMRVDGLTPAEKRGRLRVRFDGGGEFAVNVSEPVKLGVAFDGEGEFAAKVVKLQFIQPAFDGGGQLQVNIFPPVTIRPTFEGGGEFATAVRIPQTLNVGYINGGGTFAVNVRPIIELRVNFSGGGEFATDILPAPTKLAVQFSGGGEFAALIKNGAGLQWETKLPLVGVKHKSVAHNGGATLATSAWLLSNNDSARRFTRSLGDLTTFGAVGPTSGYYPLIAGDGNNIINAITGVTANPIQARSTNRGAGWGTSYDGVMPTSNYVDIYYGNGVYLLIRSTTTNNVYRSTDNGLSWQQVTLPENRGLVKVRYIDGRWLIFAQSGRLYQSIDDGQTFTIIDKPLFVDVPLDVAVMGSTLVACRVNYLSRSTDYGLTWANTVIAGSWSHIAATNGVAIAIRQDGSNIDPFVVRSEDNGVTWDFVQLPELAGSLSWPYAKIAAGFGKFVIVGDNEQIINSV